MFKRLVDARPAVNSIIAEPDTLITVFARV
jgi:hypothetical protein